MSDLPPPPPPSGGFTPPPPPPPPGGDFTPPPPPPPSGGGFTPPPPPPPPSGGGYIPPPPAGYTAGAPAAFASPRTDGLAIAALIIGILSLVCSWLCLGIILGPVAAIMGFISRGRVTASRGTVGGGGLATAGLIIGIIGFLVSAGWFVFWVILGNYHPPTST